MEFSLYLNLEEKEKKTLTAAADIIDNLVEEMDNINLEVYQDNDKIDWQKFSSKLKDLIL